MIFFWNKVQMYIFGSHHDIYESPYPFVWPFNVFFVIRVEHHNSTAAERKLNMSQLLLNMILFSDKIISHITIHVCF